MTAYRDDLDALTARHATLEAELAAKTREVAESARIVDETRARRQLPMLPNLRVASPCTADWAQMVGDERVRACAQCNKSVYNLSGMTRDEAEALLVEKEGKLCVRYYQRTDGTILLKDCVVGVRRKRRRLIVAGALTMVAGSGVGAYVLRTGETPAHVEPVTGEPVLEAVGVMAPPVAIQGGIGPSPQPPTITLFEPSTSIPTPPQ